MKFIHGKLFMNLAFNCLNENPVFVISTEGRNLVNLLIYRYIKIPRLRFAPLGMTGFTGFRSDTIYTLLREEIEKYLYNI